MSRGDGRDADEGFLGRWARRKSEIKRGVAETEAPAAQPEPGADSAAAIDAAEIDAPEKTEEEILAEFGLPAPEDLKPGDKAAGFMQAGIPEALRRRALRRIWALNPALANLDALVEYGEDYTDAARVVENLQTVYEVGAGYRRLFEDAEEAADDVAQASDNAALAEEDASQASDDAARAERAESGDPEPAAAAETETKTETEAVGIAEAAAATGGDAADALRQVDAEPAPVSAAAPARRAVRRMKFERE